jgi:hypothetical protein
MGGSSKPDDLTCEKAVQSRHALKNQGMNPNRQPPTEDRTMSEAINPELLRQLSEIVTVTEDGRHFTQAFPLWPEMERRGWIKIHRPVHDVTGISYSQEHWSLTFTREGLMFADENIPISDNEFALA